MYKLDDITASPNKLSVEYKYFKVSERILLTGHSHQAWPDVALQGQQQAFIDAATHVDDKWNLAFGKMKRVRDGYAELLDDTSGNITLSSNTHELIVRFLSALDFNKRKKIITSDSEFHTIRRQLDRLSEEGIEIVKVTVNPVNTFVERVIKEIDDNTACVMLSKVFYNTGRIAPAYTTIQERCDSLEARFLVDVYHVLNVVPFSVKNEKLENSFIVGGGYKYCQLGEGNCFLRFPKDCGLRPVITGWFSEYGALAKAKKPGEVLYGEGDMLFAGATYDPVSHYRASAVFDFFKEKNLSIKFLREVSQHQIGLLIYEFDKLNLDENIIKRDMNIKLQEIAGFLTLTTPYAEQIYLKLKTNGVLSDYRGTALRLGPAPYLSDSQLISAIQHLKSTIQTLNK